MRAALISRMVILSMSSAGEPGMQIMSTKVHVPCAHSAGIRNVSSSRVSVNWRGPGSGNGAGKPSAQQKNQPGIVQGWLIT
jgi:hypothetical protein